MLVIERWYMPDPKNHKEVTEIAGKMMKAPPEALRLAVRQEGLRMGNPDMMPDLKALQATTST